MFRIVETPPDDWQQHKTKAKTGATGGEFRCMGLLEGTRIATLYGWRNVETIAYGDPVMTFDNGIQHVVAITRAPVAPDGIVPDYAHPIRVEAGVLGNKTPLTLLPDQPVMVECDAAELLFGDPFAVLKARDLLELDGVSRVPLQPGAEVVTLHFAQDEVIHAEGGALMVTRADVPGHATLSFLHSDEVSQTYATCDDRMAGLLVTAMKRETARIHMAGSYKTAA